MPAPASTADRRHDDTLTECRPRHPHGVMPMDVGRKDSGERRGTTHALSHCRGSLSVPNEPLNDMLMTTE